MAPFVCFVCFVVVHSVQLQVFVERHMSQVSIVKVPEKPFDDEVYAAVRAALELLGGPAAFAKAGHKVLVKPNWWCWPSQNPREPAYMFYGTTDRRVVVETARLFVEHGCQVFIGEDPAVNRTVRQVYAGFKADEVARRAGAQLVDLRATGYRTIPVPAGREFKELRVSTLALEADPIMPEDASGRPCSSMASSLVSSFG